MIERTCQHCGTQFAASRITAKHCSRKCLVAASNARVKAGAPARFEKIGKQFKRRCCVCAHPDRGLVEQDIARGVSQKSLAKKYGFSGASLSRHWSRHVSAKAKAAIIAGPARRAKLLAIADETQLSTLEYFRIIRSKLFNQFIVCSDAGNHNATAIIVGRLLQTLNDLGRASGELMELVGGTTINVDMRTQIMSSPIVAEIEAGLIQTLAPYPEARKAVVAMLQGIDRRDAAPMKLVEGGAPN